MFFFQGEQFALPSTLVDLSTTPVWASTQKQLPEKQNKTKQAIINKINIDHISFSYRIGVFLRQ